MNAIRPLGLRQPETLGLSLRGDLTRLRQGDKIIMQVTMPNFPGHLQIDYLSSDGSIAHMLADDGKQRFVMTSTGWKPLGPSRPYAAGEHVTVGEADLKTGYGAWEADEPFGTDMILAVATSDAPFPQLRPANDDTTSFLRDLRGAFDRLAGRDGRLAGQVLLVETVPR